MLPIDLSNSVQLFLEQLSFKYRTVDKTTLIIRKNERQYTVYLEALPKVRIERKEPLGYFEWHDSFEFAKAAAYFVSNTSCLVSAHVDEQKKYVIFRSVSTAETSWWSLGAILYRSLDDIDQAIETFRDACSVDDDLYKLRLDELIEQGLLKELKNYPQEYYKYGTDRETND